MLNLRFQILHYEVKLMYRNFADIYRKKFGQSYLSKKINLFVEQIPFSYIYFSFSIKNIRSNLKGNGIFIIFSAKNCYFIFPQS